MVSNMYVFSGVGMECEDRAKILDYEFAFVIMILFLAVPQQLPCLVGLLSQTIRVFTTLPSDPRDL